jgi:hypothetical protein
LKSEILARRSRLEWILLAIFLVTLPLLNPWIRGDGVGYYAYARAPLIDHNLDFTHDYQSANEGFRESRCDEKGQPKAEFRTTTGHLDNHFAVGPAILWAPFLLLAHASVLFARAFGSHVAADGFSAPYRYAMAIATGLYGFLGLLLSFRLARKYIQPAWAFVATLAIWGASSLPVYMYFNPSWSHAHSAFMVALFLFYWDKTREQRTVEQWLTLGLLAGLMSDVYWPNLILLTVLAVEALDQYASILRSAPPRGLSFHILFTKQVIFCFALLLAMIPTFVSRWIVYGSPFKTGYLPLSDFLWSSPVFFSVLFSSNHGLFSWTPLIGLATVGLVLFAFHLPKIGGQLLTAAAAFYLFISFYPDWAGISSFGNRFFVSLTTLFVLGLAYLLQSFAACFHRRSVALSVSSGILACFLFWNLGLIFQWGTHLIPVRGPISFRQAAFNQFFVIPEQIKSQLQSYLFRRSDMMHQIERRDIEQLKNAHP